MRDAREVIAKSLMGDVSPDDEIGMGITHGKYAGKLSDDLLADLDEAGFAVVPREATERMMRAADKASWTSVEKMDDDATVYRAMWAAMLAASQPTDRQE